MPKPTYDPNQRIWCGPKISPLYNPDQGLGQLILRILRQTPNAVTQISADSNVHVTCKEMHDRTIKLVKYLRKCELNGGDMIGLVATNSENVAPIVFACFTLGLPINPLSTIMSVNDIVLMYSKVQPKIIFCDAENLNTVREAVNKMKFGVKIITMMDKVNEYDCVCEILEQVDAEINDEFEYVKKIRQNFPFSISHNTFVDSQTSIQIHWQQYYVHRDRMDSQKRFAYLTG